MTLPISGQPNLTKFVHKTWIYVAMIPSYKHFQKFAHKGAFFQKRQLLLEDRQRLPTSGHDFSEMNTNHGKS